MPYPPQDVLASTHFSFRHVQDNHKRFNVVSSTSSSMAPEIVYTSAKAMLAHGPMKLHQDIASKVETALGGGIPSMGIRFSHVSLSADLAKLAAQDKQTIRRQDELPTLTNEVLKAFASRFSKTHTVRKPILHDVSGSFRPGTITLVLGQAGSGKSALMKLLSGRFPMDKNITLEGEIQYNGVPREKLLKRLPQFVNYVAQVNTHLPALTVRETLEFAHECCGAKLSEDSVEYFSHGTPEENALAVSTMRNVFQHFPDTVIQALGLEDCQNTIVGDSITRGISGGERRRTTLGEMGFGLKQVAFLDEISTGLDSAAAFDIIASKRSFAKNLNRTVVISLLQPSPEIFSLFDDVLLLHEDRVLYHGPTSSVQSYFEELGLICPAKKDIADFLCELGRSDRLAREYADLWVNSALFKQLEDEADKRERAELETLGIMAKVTNDVPEFKQSFWPSMWTLLRRQAILTKRNNAFIKGRLTLVVVVGLMFGSLFYQMDLADAQVAMGVIFAASLFLGLGQGGNLVVFYDWRSVFYKQRAANFYRTSSYVLACSLSQIPLALVESLIFGSLVYWLGGLVAEAGAFILFELLLMLMILIFAAVYFFLAAAAPNLNIAKPVAMVMLLLFVLFAGFIVSKDGIPDWLSWLYWLDPVAWTVRSIAVSQYRSKKLDVCVYAGVDYCSTYNQTMGKYSLNLFDVPTDKAWVVYGVIYLVTSYVVLMILSYYVLEYRRHERPENVALPHDTVNSVGNEESYNLLSSPQSKSTSDNHGVQEAVLDVKNATRKVKVQPVAVAFKDLWYTVSVPAAGCQPAQNVDLLKGITGYALPGTLTALMGSTGAGKTTLMDVIAGRKTAGVIKGEVLLNGFPATDLSVRRCTGYCEQTDVHASAATFREALTFSAFLRQGSEVPDDIKYATVAECLDLLGLNEIADQIIRGSSMEKMKRLTIGVEMAAQPSVLFLDEPTSGLDASSAKVIMDGVRRVADSGRTVLCTIHQPSSDVFFLFDKLLLLKRGGETVYFGDLGPEGSSVVKFFEGIPTASRFREGQNPSVWMLEVLGAGVNVHDEVVPQTQGDLDHGSTSEVDFVGYFNASSDKNDLNNKFTEAGLFQPSNDMQPLSYDNKRAASSVTQLRFLLQRIFTTYWRMPSYNLTRFVISLFLGLVFGFVYLDAEYDTYQGINNGLGMIYLSTMFISIVSFVGGLPIVFEERAAFYRERAAQTYNSFWYFLSFTLVEIPYVFASSLVFIVVYYPMVGFVGFTEGVLYWVNLALLILFQAYLTQLAIFLSSSMEAAMTLGVLINSIGLMLTGFNPPTLRIPSGYKWIYAIAPHRYTFSSLAGVVFGDCSNDQLVDVMVAAASPGGISSFDFSKYPLGCRIVQKAPAAVGEIPVKMYVQVVFGVKHEHIGQYAAIFVAILLLFRVVAALAMRFINHQQR
ncbi:unnamed protein product [Phytophthora lilii]|uniref:Unnamed protein product n=1 Tax=Phytophthora lilii TaxID=2077276 RepID=A0A9W6WRA8_9STRA|nr:unnamed protein product [Phytophthora lilii]